MGIARRAAHLNRRAPRLTLVSALGTEHVPVILSRVPAFLPVPITHPCHVNIAVIINGAPDPTHSKEPGGARRAVAVSGYLGETVLRQSRLGDRKHLLVAAPRLAAVKTGLAVKDIA